MWESYMAAPSPALEEYFCSLRDGSRTWTEETLIAGIRRFAAVAGYQRAKYFGNPGSGLHYPSEVEELWHQTHPHTSRATTEDFGWICPPTWSLKIKDHKCTYVYRSSGKLSEGLNEFVAGPTSLDCGMFAELVIVMGIRYMIGDEVFNEAFETPGRPFRIVQSWNKSGPDGNPLYAFYDLLGEPRGRIRTTIFHNHSSYRSKHPGGPSGLQNTTQIDDEYFLFDPSSSSTSLSSHGVLQHLVDGYNKARDSADLKALARWNQYPECVHPRFAPLSYGEMYKKALQCADDTIDMDMLRQDQKRRPSSCFNFQRLTTCLKAVSPSPKRVNVLSMAEKAHVERLREDAERDLIPCIVQLKEVDSRLAQFDSMINDRGKSESGQGSDRRGLECEIDTIVRQLHEDQAAKWRRPHELLRHVNAILADFDPTSGPLSVGEDKKEKD